MPNSPVMMIVGHKVKPEHQERFGKWVTEAYFPLIMKLQQMGAVDRYENVNDISGYPKNITIDQFKDFESSDEFVKNSLYTSILQDQKTTFVDAGRMEWFWRALYEQIGTFKANLPSNSSQDKLPENGPYIHLEGYRLFPDEEEKYENWMTKWGLGFYIPALMRLPGIKKYNFYKLLDYKFPETLRPKGTGIHPAYLSILFFDRLDAYQNYEKSIEVAAMREALKEHFDRDLEFKWSVQFKQILSMQK